MHINIHIDIIKINVKRKIRKRYSQKTFSSYFNQNQSKTRCYTIKYFSLTPCVTHIFLTIPFQAPRHRVGTFCAGNQGYFTVHIDNIVDPLKKSCIIKAK